MHLRSPRHFATRFPTVTLLTFISALVAVATGCSSKGASADAGNVTQGAGGSGQASGGGSGTVGGSGLSGGSPGAGGVSAGDGGTGTFGAGGSGGSTGGASASGGATGLGGTTATGGATGTGGSAAAGGATGTGGTTGGGGSGNTAGSGGATGAPGVRIVARTAPGTMGGTRFEWSGSSVSARFMGTQVSVQLNDGSNGNAFEVVIDGGTPKKIFTASGQTTLPLATGLPAGTHDLLLWRDTEASDGPTEVIGLTNFGAGGALLPPAPA